MASWIDRARSYIGLREIPGARHNPTILGWWQRIFADFRDDETPWCAAFVGGVLEEVGIKSTRSAAARSYLKWGAKLDRPAPGCVVVFWRGSRMGWSGHVGFVVGEDRAGNLMVLGGNQSNAVSIAAFSRDRVLGYRWPASEPLPVGAAADLPLMRGDGRLSTNEA